MEHVRPRFYQGQGCLAPCGGIIEAVEVDLAALNGGIDTPGSVQPTLVGSFDRWELNASDETQQVAPGQSSGNHPRQIARFLQPKNDRGDVAMDPTARSDDE